MRSSITCLAFAVLSLPALAADSPPRAVKEIEREIEATEKKLAELRAELLASQQAQKPKPKADLTLSPPIGGHVVLGATSAAYEAYEAAVADGNKAAAADLVDRGLVVLVAEPVRVVVKKRGPDIDYVSPVDGPHAGRTWAIAATGLPRK
jgi:hypothetical protein